MSADDGTAQTLLFGDIRLHRNTDGGATWTRFSDLPPLGITKLVVDPSNPTRLYAGTTGSVWALR